MEVKDLRRLMDAMKAAGVAELELEWDGSEDRPGGRVALRREGTTAVGGVPSQPALPPADAGAVAVVAPATGAPATGAAATTAVGAAAVAAAEAKPSGVDVVAPIVGTFYASPSPDAGIFVRVGDQVKVGQVLCIIEAMKLMNEIEAEVAGTVVEILVRDSDPVEYGQVLMRIVPA